MAGLHVVFEHVQVPGGIVVAVSVNGIFTAVAPAMVFVVLDMPGVLGSTTIAPSFMPPSVVPGRSDVVTPATAVPPIVTPAVLTA